MYHLALLMHWSILYLLLKFSSFKYVYGLYFICNVHLILYMLFVLIFPTTRREGAARRRCWWWEGGVCLCCHPAYVRYIVVSLMWVGGDRQKIVENLPDNFVHVRTHVRMFAEAYVAEE